MTQKPTQERGSSRMITRVWMGVATLSVVGLMYWLAATSEPSAPVVVEAEGSGLESEGATPVSLDELAAGLSSYFGMDVRLENIQVASRLGDQAFWTTTSNGVPFLVRIGAGLVADSFTVAAGDVVSLVGRVSMMSDSVLDAWEQEGVLTDENQRLEAEFATGYVEATLAVKSAAPEPAAES